MVFVDNRIQYSAMYTSGGGDITPPITPLCVVSNSGDLTLSNYTGTIVSGNQY